jgi:hypothetical protein
MQSNSRDEVENHVRESCQSLTTKGISQTTIATIHGSNHCRLLEFQTTMEPWFDMVVVK